MEHERDYFRVDASMPLAIRELSKEEQETASCRLEERFPVATVRAMKDLEVNISGNGLSFQWDKYFDKGQIIEVTIFLQDVFSGLLMLACKVVRCQEMWRSYGLAVQFVNIEPKISDMITAFVLKRERELRAEKRVGWL